MDYLEVVIEELKREKQTLLAKKNKNLEKIEEYEEKIKYYTYLYNQYKQDSINYGIFMNSLKKTSQFSKKEKSLFEIPDLSLLLSGPSLNILIEERYSDLKRRKLKSDKKKAKAEKCLDYYIFKTSSLQEENKDIDIRVEEIDIELEKKQNRIENKILRKLYIEGGKEND